jgi:hypothetical protein
MPHVAGAGIALLGLIVWFLPDEALDELISYFDDIAGSLAGNPDDAIPELNSQPRNS